MNDEMLSIFIHINTGAGSGLCTRYIKLLAITSTGYIMSSSVLVLYHPLEKLTVKYNVQNFYMKLIIYTDMLSLLIYIT